ncbi:sphingosine hydroxylase [Polyporus arcularius HHB13444]|uniref:Sphingosine hydroxylase n=1 Tax=Polyporus arcularius HHB13444 TaxID=1314778 RepID=A0A5C3PWD4_9APHY|nr:sphingosine hydroxylase [Polyporus arcularius HHB13444]
MNATFLDRAQLRYLSDHTPFYYSPKVALVPWFADNILALAAPVIAYWVLSLVFHWFDMSEWKWLDKYRLHESEEVKSRNLVTRTDVVIAVVFQHIVQTAIGYLWVEDKPAGAQIDHLANMVQMAPYLERVATGVLGKEAGAQLLASRGADGLYSVYWWAIPVAKFFLGMFIIDTWQYFLHRAMHTNSYLYKKFHSWHHRLYVPFAFGALYNHPVEGFLLDTCGAGIAEWIAHMSTREAMLLFVVSTLKTVDDHCGYKLPWDPLQMFSPNNADYHDIHHQVIGIKSNFSQPFFIHWDAILGTRMTRKDIELRRSKRQTQKAQ